jgi:hypothetical protein
MIEKVLASLKAFDLNLENRIVLTEAASGNYVVTPIIAALAGAEVVAFTKDSSFGSTKEIEMNTLKMAESAGVKSNIRITMDWTKIDFASLDIVTNTGFLRPLDGDLIDRLSSGCVIPLMYEPWEYNSRKGEVDLENCVRRGIKVYGTNENDERLRTMEYIGYTVLYLLLEEKLSPFSARVLLVGCHRFVEPVNRILTKNGYKQEIVTKYDRKPDPGKYHAIVVLEHERPLSVIGGDDAFLRCRDIGKDTVVIHICGNVQFDNETFRFYPRVPRPFGYMSYTTDFIDPKAVIDLHTAGLKVAEGMLKANELGYTGGRYKDYMEANYPAKAFDDEKYW